MAVARYGDADYDYGPPQEVIPDEVQKEFTESVEQLLSGGFAEVRDGGPLSSTGEEYVELSIRALSVEALVTATAGAVSGFRRGLGRETRLYWRVRPEFSKRGEQYKSYVRFLVTDKPEIYATENESRAAARLKPASET